MKTFIYTFLMIAFYSGTLSGQIVINEIIPPNTVEIRNLGASTVNISSYTLCQFPSYNQLSSITQVCGGDLMIEGGSLITVNVTYNLSANDDELALYIMNGSFENPANIVDYVEWGSTGHVRSTVAVAAGIWSSGDFVPSFTGCASLEYDGSGNSSTDWVSQDVATTPCITNTLNGCGLMPLDLLSFHVSQVENGAAISWNAIHDNTVQMILLEHSANADDWKTMTEWQPTGPDFDGGEYHHQNIASGTHYYRLLIQYSDGLTEFSPIALLHMCYDTDEVSVWPNPTQGIIDVFVQSIELLAKAEFQLVDTHGKICISQWGSHQMQMDLSHLPEGIYFLHIPVLGLVLRVVKT